MKCFAHIPSCYSCFLSSSHIFLHAVSILCFALFCGMLIIFNYVLNMFLVFPAICLYDIWLMRGSRNILVNFGCCTKSIVKTENSNENITKRSLIHKILDYYYKLLHKVRYGVLVGCIIATIVCIYFGLKVRKML